MRPAMLLPLALLLPALAGAAEEHHVTILDLAYDPQVLAVRMGDTVTWTNADGLEHTVTAFDLAFDSGNMEDGATFSHTFDLPGAHPYFCLYHPLMEGAVVVAA